jgi:hypothetical protein
MQDQISDVVKLARRVATTSLISPRYHPDDCDRPMVVVVRGGFDPPTFRFSGGRSSD